MDYAFIEGSVVVVGEKSKGFLADCRRTFMQCNFCAVEQWASENGLCPGVRATVHNHLTYRLLQTATASATGWQ